MGIFGGWYPPGCSSTPYDEPSAMDISENVRGLFGGKLPDGVLGVFWDEDGGLIETFAVTVPADPEGGYPEYSECQDAYTGATIEWNDDWDDEENAAAAARQYSAYKMGKL